MKTANTSLLFRFLLAFLLSLGAYGLLQYFLIRESNPQVVKKEVVKKLNHVTRQIVATDSLVGYLMENHQPSDWKYYDRYLGDHYTSVVIRKGDSLVYWNNAQWPDNVKLLGKGKPQIVFSSENWYLSEKQMVNGYSVSYFYRLQDRYSARSDAILGYIKDYFLLPHRIKFVTDLQQPGVIFIDEFHIGFVIEKGYNTPYTIFALYFFYVLSYLLLFFLIYSFYKAFRKYFPGLTDIHFLIFTFLDLIFIRGLDVFVGFSELVKQTFLFKESVLSVAGFSTLGDMILNLALLTVFLVLLRKQIYKLNQTLVKQARLKGALFMLFGFGVILGLYMLADYFLAGLDQQYFLSDSFFSFFGLSDLFFIAYLGVLVYWMTDAIARFFTETKLRLFYGLIIIVVLALLSWILFRPEPEILWLATAVVMAMFSLSYAFSQQISPYIYSLLVLIVLSLSGAVLLNHTQLEVRNAHQKITASIVSQKNDPYLEYTLKSLSQDVLKDSTLQTMLYKTPYPNEQSVSKYIDKQYFNGYFDKYSKQLTVCRPGQQLQIQPGNQIIGCNDYFSQLPGKTVYKNHDFSLILIQNHQENIYYLAKFSFPPPDSTEQPVNLYMELFADFVPTSIGYPYKSGGNNMQYASGYSFARYLNGKLQYKFGDFMYPVDFTYFKDQPRNQFFYQENFKHIMVKSGPNDYLIVSRPQDSLSVWLLPFSELFLLFSLFLILYIVFTYGGNVLNLLRYSFRARLQLIFFSSVLFVFVFLSVIALYYFNENNRNRISDSLKEKTHSVLIEMQHKFSNVSTINPQNDLEIQSYLQKFASVFFTDINLYDRSGWLIASSSPEIFEKGLQSRLINPQAYDEIQRNHQLFYLSKERLGRTVFYSSYVPLTLMDGKEAGIINLPYFARQNEIQHSYYQMLANLLNLFVITGILGLIIMMYLSRILIKPLQMLHQKINLVSIEKKNEKIVWNDRDEIGQLIEAYNQMVEKLEHSAELMKYTERERAWREMARQITHEIRNPLTPMKLNVQYLQKAYEQKDVSFDEKLKNISATLISQIETLNEVAGMFSDFSKSSIPRKSRANLIKALKENISFFKKSFHVEFNLMTTDEDIWVQAAPKDLIRIFNNLSKNAIQAMENTDKKQIDISIVEEKNHVSVLFRDYGPGISQENNSRIFQPYFTTKSTGTGLGLAIVRNMMREWEGSVSFESEPGAGTTFILRFKKMSPEENDTSETDK